MRICLKHFLLIILATFVFVSCEKNDVKISDVAVFIRPSMSDTLSLMSGNKVVYELEFHTTGSDIQRLQVNSYDNVYGETHVIDTVFTEQVTKMNYTYTAPEINCDSVNVKLLFTVYDDKGRKAVNERYLIVKQGLVLLPELTGIVLWNPELGIADALCMENPTQTFSWQKSPDSLKADIYIEADNAFSNITMKSNTAAKFIRNNSFDYPRATGLGLQSVYSNSVRTDEVNDLRVNDIIIIGHSNSVEGIIRVANIVRNAQPSEQCVQLNIKASK